MPEISVDLGSNSYKIKIHKGSLAEAGSLIRGVSRAAKAAVITDDTVDGLYGSVLEQKLSAAGFAVRRIAFPHGEESKSLATLAQVYDELADFGLTRSDLIVTLGGGVPGDLGGLAAATYMRGIPFVQIPTTLLAQVDSSVGGKVAVDLPAGKNLVGAFYQPKLVIIDPEMLSTLPARYLHDGLAEVIKYGAFGDAKLFEQLESLMDDKDLLDNIEPIITRCCEIKARIVERDEHDTGERMVLNFGHTIGHAVEKAFHYHTYTHGEAVGIGMVRMTRRTEERGITAKGTAARIEALLRKFALPTEAEVSTAYIREAIALDKKKSGSSISIVVLDRIGQCHIEKIEMGK